MLDAMGDIVSRLRSVVILLAAFVLISPAFASDVCAAETSPTAAASVVDAHSDPGEACPDCGPACANGCCHAPHPAVAGDDLSVEGPSPAYAAPRPWTQSLGLPMGPPGGPERPPRA